MLTTRIRSQLNVILKEHLQQGNIEFPVQPNYSFDSNGPFLSIVDSHNTLVCVLKGYEKRLEVCATVIVNYLNNLNEKSEDMDTFKYLESRIHESENRIDITSEDAMDSFVTTLEFDTKDQLKDLIDKLTEMHDEFITKEDVKPNEDG